MKYLNSSLTKNEIVLHPMHGAVGAAFGCNGGALRAKLKYF